LFLSRWVALKHESRDRQDGTKRKFARAAWVDLSSKAKEVQPAPIRLSDWCAVRQCRGTEQSF